MFDVSLTYLTSRVRYLKSWKGADEKSGVSQQILVYIFLICCTSYLEVRKIEVHYRDKKNWQAVILELIRLASDGFSLLMQGIYLLMLLKATN